MQLRLFIVATGKPNIAELRPTYARSFVVRVQSNGVNSVGFLIVYTDGRLLISTSETVNFVFATPNNGLYGYADVTYII